MLRTLQRQSKNKKMRICEQVFKYGRNDLHIHVTRIFLCHNVTRALIIVHVNVSKNQWVVTEMGMISKEF